ncbi:helix-turn-helix domain-containing protein [Pantoea agglomerans]|uniref:helix-turn-helix domain-containing protein n=1 Tax=Enterobacter agglomerans TaxID=549 RepID=UPI0010C2014D|nr:korC [Pantoea agglomerans]MBD8145438.1 korC [Pantoea agglomerans]MBD8184170.1 korC [Pantoea agglomerans]MBD8223119.1 korC [Pantoea agglomerans]TKJ54220.1 korC [Pantoea agglomerans]TKK12387.1 korC [Pantoea agglomerans]
MKPEHARHILELIELEKFNPETLCSGESWKAPSATEIRVVRALIPLTDIQLANRLDVDERTIRKWKSGKTRIAYTTWCCLCWLAGLGMPLDNIISG